MVASSNSSENDTGGKVDNQWNRNERDDMLQFSHLPAATANSIPPGDQFIRLSGWLDVD